jgi:ribosome recycling factor
LSSRFKRAGLWLPCYAAKAVARSLKNGPREPLGSKTMAAFDKEDANRRMNGAVATLKTEFSGLRTGRASAALLEPVTVEAYGNAVPINQVGTVSVPEPRLLTVQVWDKGLVKTVDKAIRDAGLGLNPQADGQLLRIPVPELNEERRKELAKLASKYAEQARIAVRNVRRDGMEVLKKLEKDHKIGQDEHHKFAEEMQKLTDAHIKDIDQLLHSKEQEIMQV